MKILGIDTSFDDTSVAIVENGTKILSNVVLSQKTIHEHTGGVIPEIAARTHTERIIETLKLALTKAQLQINDIDAIAITGGPGLVGSLLVGTATGSILGMFISKPIYNIHHVWGHLYANFLEREIHKISFEELFPILVLTVAGGHNDIVVMRDWNNFEIIGSTRDDASGEAFDKAARLIGIADFMGGPTLSKFAALGKPRNEFKLPRAMSQSKDLDFSFSGLKTAVRQMVEKQNNLTEQDKYDLAYELEMAICEVLTQKLITAKNQINPQTIFVTGGVSANDKLKEMITSNIKDLTTYFPISKPLCTDNAAMIAGACFFMKDKLTPCDFVLATPGKTL